jgi:hypothetical protein
MHERITTSEREECELYVFYNRIPSQWLIINHGKMKTTFILQQKRLRSNFRFWGEFSCEALGRLRYFTILVIVWLCALWMPLSCSPLICGMQLSYIFWLPMLISSCIPCPEFIIMMPYSNFVLPADGFARVLKFYSWSFLWVIFWTVVLSLSSCSSICSSTQTSCSSIWSSGGEQLRSGITTLWVTYCCRAGKKSRITGTSYLLSKLLLSALKTTDICSYLQVLPRDQGQVYLEAGGGIDLMAGRRRSSSQVLLHEHLMVPAPTCWHDGCCTEEKLLGGSGRLILVEEAGDAPRALDGTSFQVLTWWLLHGGEASRWFRAIDSCGRSRWCSTST